MFRIAYSIEFLIAIIAIFTFWSQVGGQAHLDLMPWYLKMGFSVAAASVCVKLTAATVVNDRIWNKAVLRWLLALLLLGAAGAAVTYYYHLTEPPEPEDSEAVYTSSVRRLMTRTAHYRAATVRKRLS